MRRGVATVLAVLGLVTGCAATEQWAYDKKGVTPAIGKSLTVFAT